jgi:hypothetical protein
VAGLCQAWVKSIVRIVLKSCKLELKGMYDVVNASRRFNDSPRHLLLTIVSVICRYREMPCHDTCC